MRLQPCRTESSALGFRNIHMQPLAGIMHYPTNERIFNIVHGNALGIAWTRPGSCAVHEAAIFRMHPNRW
jgi:hypothetical protein